MGGGAPAGTVARQRSAAAPLPEIAISRYRALPRERNTPAGRAYQGELTTPKHDPDEEPREACGLEKWTVVTR
jgi:hypothetical protein